MLHDKYKPDSASRRTMDSKKEMYGTDDEKKWEW